MVYEKLEKESLNSLFRSRKNVENDIIENVKMAYFQTSLQNDSLEKLCTEKMPAFKF